MSERVVGNVVWCCTAFLEELTNNGREGVETNNVWDTGVGPKQFVRVIHKYSLCWVEATQITISFFKVWIPHSSWRRTTKWKHNQGQAKQVEVFTCSFHVVSAFGLHVRVNGELVRRISSYFGNAENFDRTGPETGTNVIASKNRKTWSEQRRRDLILTKLETSARQTRLGGAVGRGGGRPSYKNTTQPRSRVRLTRRTVNVCSSCVVGIYLWSAAIYLSSCLWTRTMNLPLFRTLRSDVVGLSDHFVWGAEMSKNKSWSDAGGPWTKRRLLEGDMGVRHFAWSENCRNARFSVFGKCKFSFTIATSIRNIHVYDQSFCNC